MQQEFYISCIKINGIPLLPPLITDSIKEEMRCYRSLAVKIEEKLKNKQLSRHTIKDKCVQADMESIQSIDKLKDIKYNSDSDISSHNTMSDTNNSDSYSKMTIVEPVKQANEEKNNKHSIQSPALDVQRLQSQVCLINDSVNVSKPITLETDQNECVNVTEVATPNEDIISVESWKPEVPRTLDIVPITLSNKEDNVLTTISKESENLPKLSRQGSYILDTPSPMLLAHMHTELIDKNYVPTPTTDVSQRTQWNIVQPKVEWENKQLVTGDTEASNELECRTQESTFEHIEPDTLPESYQTNKSVSCMEPVAPEDHICSSDVMPTKPNQESNDNFKKQHSLERSNRDSETCVLNFASKSQESIVNANSSKAQLFCKDENKHRDKMEDTKKCQDSVVKIKSSITPEKLLTVYKEIEEMHKKQMMELINRQRKEQLLLQAEFKKQQMLLLGEIRKCSFGISNQVNVSNVNSNQTLSNNEAEEDIDSEAKHQLNINSPSNSCTDMPCNSKLLSEKRANVIICPLDYISPKDLYLLKHHKSPSLIAETSFANRNYRLIRKVNSCDATYNNNNNNDYDDDNDDNSNWKLGDRIVHKNSTVNRQLFPLDSNTTHVPVLDTSVYLDKHVRAVNIINAYTRGYLVRRLMRTERLITLKKIYKEALQCMLKLHVDAPLNLAEVGFLHRLQLQCDAASLNIVEVCAQPPAKRMEVIAQDREIKQSRTERPTSARSYSFATQKTLARKNLKEFDSTMTKYQRPLVIKKSTVRSRCQTWTSDIRDRLISPNTLYQSIRRSTSAGTVRKPWR